MRQPQGKRKYLEKKAAALLATGLSISATAEELGIYRSTLHRWLNRSDFPGSVANATSGSNKKSNKSVSQASSSDLEVWVRENYELTPADEEVLGLTLESLKMSENPLLDEKVRLQAMSRFQSLLRDLKLSIMGSATADKDKKQPQRQRDRVRSFKGDPRGVLGVVSK